MGAGVHLPHCLLRLHRGRPVGRSHHLQDQEALGVPVGHEEPLHELRPLLRDGPCLRPLLHPWHGQGPEDVPLEDQLVAARHPLLYPDLVLRRDEKVLAASKPWRLDCAGNLLLEATCLLSSPLHFCHNSLVLNCNYYETSCCKLWSNGCFKQCFKKKIFFLKKKKKKKKKKK